MYWKPNRKQVRNGLKEGWSKEDAERGFSIFQSFELGKPPLLNIQAIEDVYGPDMPSAEDCAREAERIGLCKIIPVEELPKDFFGRYSVWVDTPENREAIASC